MGLKRKSPEAQGAIDQVRNVGFTKSQSRGGRKRSQKQFQMEQNAPEQGEDESKKKLFENKVLKYVMKNPEMVNPEFSKTTNDPWGMDSVPVTYDSWDYVPAPPSPVKKTRNVDVWVFNKKTRVVVTCEADAVDEWILKQEGELYGVDIEWKPNRERGVENKVALIQICSEKDCLMVQTLFLDRTPDALVRFLDDPKKKLGGIGIRQDAKKLMRDFEWKCQGIVELAPLAATKMLDPKNVEKADVKEVQNTGLRKLTMAVLGLSLDKPKWVTMSNWAKWNLDRNQVNYACVDAWVSYAILEKLLSLPPKAVESSTTVASPLDI